MQDSGIDGSEHASRQVPASDDFYEIALIKKCIMHAGGPCSTEYIKNETGYNLKDISQARIYNYFVKLGNEDPVRGYKYEYNKANDTFEYVKDTQIKTVEDFVKYLDSQEKSRTEGLKADDVIDVLCPKRVVKEAKKENKIIWLRAPDKKIKHILSFKEGEDCETLVRKKEEKAEVRCEFDKSIESLKSKKVEKLLEEKGLFVFKNPEQKVEIPTKPRRGKRPGTTSKTVTK